MISPLNPTNNPVQFPQAPPPVQANKGNAPIQEEEINKIGQKKLPPFERPESDSIKKHKISVQNGSSIHERVGFVPEQEEGAQRGKKRDPSFERPESESSQKVAKESMESLEPSASEPFVSELWQAAHDGQWDVVRDLLKRPEADINATASEGPLKGFSVLWLAAFKQQWDLVKEMLKMRNADVNAAPSEGLYKGFSVLWIAAKKEQWDLVKEMLKRPDADVNNAPSEGPLKGVSVLWIAATKKQWGLVKKMLKMRNANVNATVLEGSFKSASVLWLAAFRQQWELVKEMLKQPEADVNSAPSEGPNTGASVLWLAAFRQQWDLVKEMLKMRNADVNNAPSEGSYKGLSVLRSAASSQQWELVKEMLKKPNANVNAAPLEGRDKGVSVLRLAVSQKQWDLVKEMLKRPDADVNAARLLCFAAYKQQWDLVKEMLKRPDVDVNATSLDLGFGVSVLYIAACQGQWDIVKEMIERPDIDIQTAPSIGPGTDKNVISVLLANRQQRKLLSYCLLKFSNIKTPTNSLNKDKTYFKEVKKALNNASAKIIPLFFDRKKMEPANQDQPSFFPNKLISDLKVMFCRKAILTEMDLLPLESMPDIVKVMNSWIEHRMQNFAEQHDVIKKLAFREWRSNQDISGQDAKSYGKRKINDTYKMIERSIVEVRKSHPDLFFDHETRQKIIKAISQLRNLNKKMVVKAIRKTLGLPANQ